MFILKIIKLYHYLLSLYKPGHVTWLVTEHKINPNGTSSVKCTLVTMAALLRNH